MLHNTSTNTFQADVLASDIPVLVDFWAEWCGPCKSMLPVLEQVATELEGRVRIVKVDVDSQKELAAKFGVRGIPTLILFNQGERKGTLVGTSSKQAIEQLVSA